jgi:FkbM family methyltransferase
MSWLQYRVRLLAWRLHTLRGQRVTVNTSHGRLTLDPVLDQGSISRSLYCRRDYNSQAEATVLAFLRSQNSLPPAGTGTIVDIGANIGLTAIGLLMRGEFQSAVAVEPEPGSFALLEHNVRQNGLTDRVTTLRYAAAEQMGTGVLAIHSRNAGGHHLRPVHESDAGSPGTGVAAVRRTIAVETVTLDELAADGRIPPSTALIWMDAQGSEGRIIAGAPRLLSRSIPVVTEVSPRFMKKAGVTPRELCMAAESRWRRFGIIAEATVAEHPIEELPRVFERWPAHLAKRDLVFW